MGFLTVLVSTLLISQAPAPAAAPDWFVEVTPDGVRLSADVFGATTELSTMKLGPVNDAVRRGNVIYVARAAGGIQIIDAQNPRAPLPAGGFREDSVVLHLAVNGDQLVAVSKGSSFLLYDLSHPLHPRLTTAANATTSNGTPAQGKVLAARDGIVIIDGGTNQGFAQGRNVAIYSHTRASESDKVAREAGMQMPGMLVGVVRLERVEADRSLATYGRGDDPQPGDSVVLTNESMTANLSGPRAIPFVWRLDLALRPFLGVGTDGYPVGILIDGAVACYLRDIPLRLQVGIVPIGFVAGASVAYNPINLDATVAFYTPFFEVGFGGGFNSVVVPASPLTPQSYDTQGTLDQSLRIGELDGVNFIWFSAIGYGTNSFDLASARAEFNVPLTRRLTLGFEGGGGRGFAYADFVLRTYVGGQGGPGTFILSGGFGGAGAIAPTDPPFVTPSAGGPALVLELEARL